MCSARCCITGTTHGFPCLVTEQGAGDHTASGTLSQSCGCYPSYTCAPDPLLGHKAPQHQEVRVNYFLLLAGLQTRNSGREPWGRCGLGLSPDGSQARARAAAPSAQMGWSPRRPTHLTFPSLVAGVLALAVPRCLANAASTLSSLSFDLLK